MKIKDLTLCALFAALMAVCAWITVPMPGVPFTMQTFALFLTLAILGGMRGSIVCVVYLLLGAVGLPVFSGFRGGMGVLLGVTGGYIWGFLATALIYWYVTRVFGNAFRVQILAMVLGLIACYALGSGWFMLVYLKGAKSITLWAVLTKCVIPFILPDLAKLSLALVLGKRLQPMLR